MTEAIVILMNTMSLSNLDPAAPDFESSVDKLSEMIALLLKKGILKNISFSYDRLREHEVKDMIKKYGLTVFDEDEVKFK